MVRLTPLLALVSAFSVLEISIADTEQETQCAFGSAGEVQRFEAVVGTKYL